MFDQFTERARRVIFFARLEASKTGSHAISTEHFLLGLMYENTYLLPELPTSLAALRTQLFGPPPSQTVSQSVDIPLTESAQRALQRSANERYALKHNLVTSGHVLLGILGEEGSDACAILKRYGIQREQVLTRLPDSSEEDGPPPPDIRFDFLS
jgi:ATP-dependent Clp protease ATP-binding subunit ClpC